MGKLRIKVSGYVTYYFVKEYSKSSIKSNVKVPFLKINGVLLNKYLCKNFECLIWMNLYLGLSLIVLKSFSFVLSQRKPLTTQI